MKIKCDNCGKAFIATKAQLATIEKATKERRSVIVLGCGVCHLGFIFRPIPASAKVGDQDESPLLRCPVPTCAGFVVPIKQKSRQLYSCGECGAVWKSAEALHAEIDSIVSRYAYRRKCYRKQKGHWLPAPAEKEPKNYDTLVERESPED